MKLDPTTHTLHFADDDEVARFHGELTALVREAVTAASRHGDAGAGKAAAQSVFKQYPVLLRALNALRRELGPGSGAREDPDPAS